MAAESWVGIGSGNKESTDTPPNPGDPVSESTSSRYFSKLPQGHWPPSHLASSLCGHLWLRQTPGPGRQAQAGASLHRDSHWGHLSSEDKSCGDSVWRGSLHVAVCGGWEGVAWPMLMCVFWVRQHMCVRHCVRAPYVCVGDTMCVCV